MYSRAPVRLFSSFPTLTFLQLDHHQTTMTLRRQSSRNKLDTKSTSERTSRTSKRISSWEEDQQPAKRHKAANAGLPSAAKTTLSQPPARKLTYQRLFADKPKPNAEPLVKKKAANATPKKTITKSRTPHQKLPLLGRITDCCENHHMNTDI